MSNSMHYNGTDLSGTTYGLTVVRPTPRRIVANPILSSNNVPQSYGGLAYCGGFGMVEIGATVVCEGSSISDLASKMDALKYLLNPMNGEKSIRFDHQSDRYWLGRLMNEIEAADIGDRSSQFDLRFLCSDSRAYGTTDRSSPDITISATPQVLTIEAAAAVVGTAPTNPTWVIKNTSGATVSSLSLANATTGETWAWTGTLINTTGWLRITTGLGGKTEVSTNSGGAWSDSNLGVTGQGFPTLAGNVQNSLTLTGLSGGTVVLTYTPRYL